jgi:hypothetical protein
MPLFRKKPVTVEAVQLLPENWTAMRDFIGVGAPGGLASPTGARYCKVDAEGRETLSSNCQLGLIVPTIDGRMLAKEGDWIVRGTHGEVYPVKRHIFEAVYERVEVPSQPKCSVVGCQSTVQESGWCAAGHPVGAPAGLKESP